MAKGFNEIKGSIYYFGNNGVMRTGKIKIGNQIYVFKKNGKLKKSYSSK